MTITAQTTSEIKLANHWDHVLARFGVRRTQHRVNPGLYALGSPSQESEVFVTANYTLSFDALRAALTGRDAYILVLDTHGVNVWCAAGKGTFGTEELVAKVKAVELANIVKHRKLILPQLGATGVRAHMVKETADFEVEYGPVLAEDLPEYLRTHTATPEMRRVRFNLRDRLVLTPVELVNSFWQMVLIGGVFYLADGWFSLIWVLAGWLAATVLFMALLPWLPTREFSTKGFFLGALISLPFIFYQLLLSGKSTLYNVMRVLPTGLIVTALIAYYSLNMTGSTPITSWTSVKREISRYIPVMAAMTCIGIILIVLRLFGIGS